MSMIEVKKVYKRFGKQEVLNNISLTVEQGERFGLIGPNGAGKSTLIDILTGLINFDAGQVMINGLDIKKDKVKIRQDIGLVPQELALLEAIDAKSNLEYFGGLYGLSGKVLKERIEEALEITGLSDQDKKATKKYSGGMKRRLNIAAAILHRPKLLIMDEPTVGVDPQSRNKIFEFVKYMNEQYRTTVLYTSHYMEEIEALTNRLFILDKGKQIAYGTQDEIKSMVQENVKWVVEMKDIPSDFAQKIETEVKGVEHAMQTVNQVELIVDPICYQSKQLMNLLNQEDVELISLSKDELSLEEAFLKLTGKKLRD